jgi:hypothetical protein
MFLVGVTLCALFLFEYVGAGFVVTKDTVGFTHLAVIGITLIMISVLAAGFTILLQALADRIRVAERA